MTDSSSLAEQKARALRERRERVHQLLEKLWKQRDLETRVEEKARLDALIAEKEQELQELEGATASGGDVPAAQLDLSGNGEDPVPPPSAEKNRWEGLVIALGVAVALLTLVGGVLDLPGKWKEWREHMGAPTRAETQTETQVLRGEVSHGTTGRLLPGALVEIPAYFLGTKTDERGRFSFEVPVAPDERVRVRILLEGFEVKNEDPMPGTGQFQKYRLKEMRE